MTRILDLFNGTIPSPFLWPAYPCSQGSTGVVSTKGCITRDRGVGAAGNAKVFLGRGKWKVYDEGRKV